MKKRSFSLIELLIVIIIIGVLAALAVPQYEQLVINARGAEAMRVVKAISDAAWQYRLEKGTFTPEVPGDKPPWSELGIQPVPSKYWKYIYHWQSYDPVCVMIQAGYIGAASYMPAGSKVVYSICYTYDAPHATNRQANSGYQKLDEHFYINYMGWKATGGEYYKGYAGW